MIHFLQHPLYRFNYSVCDLSKKICGDVQFSETTQKGVEAFILANKVKNYPVYLIDISSQFHTSLGKMPEFMGQNKLKFTDVN